MWVRVCAGHTDALCVNGWTDRDAVWGLTLVGQGTTIRRDQNPSKRKADFGLIKKLWVSAAMFAAMVTKGIIQSSITA